MSAVLVVAFLVRGRVLDGDAERDRDHHGHTVGLVMVALCVALAKGSRGDPMFRDPVMRDPMIK